MNKKINCVSAKTWENWTGFLLWWNLRSIYFSQKCGNQDKHSNLAFEVRLSCHVTLTPPPPHPHCPSSPLNLPWELHSCWGPLFQLTAGGLQHPLGPKLSLLSTTASDFAHCNHSLPWTFKRAQTSHGSCLAGKRIHAKADHLRAPGVDLWRAAHVSYCLLHSRRIRKGKGCEDPWDWAEKGK